ncbi:phage tail length tape measure family protein [Methylopila sp. Yamaguchi]|uniref:phage tail length tape measure family protein n=1 Tax=Methylopila sp. Yamaguchi TaxID=1437817 RepID=UPI0013584C2E|nr:phage tail length tape measure family protein [Methylopila sp. Yamaguchi]
MQRALETAGAATNSPLDQAHVQVHASLNRELGLILNTTKAASDSGAAFERELVRMETAASQLRSELNPLAAAQAKLTAEIADYRTMASMGVITTDELAAAAGRARQKFDEMAAGVQKAPTVQSRIDNMVGVRSDFGGAQRGEDVQAYGTQLDQLRARFSPLFAAQERYRSDLDEINRAHRVGAISDGERAAALARTKSAFAEQIGVLNGTTAAARQAGAALAETAREAQRAASAQASYRSGGWDRLGAMGGQNLANIEASRRISSMGKTATDASKGVGLLGHQWQNLSFQVNDGVTMLMSGSSILQVIATQSGQTFQILQSAPGGAMKALKEVAASVWAMVTPLTVSGAAAVAFGVYAAYAFDRASTSAKQLEQSLQGLGRLTGTTVAEAEAAAQRAAAAGNVSVRVARERVAALMATGNVGPQLAEQLSGDIVEAFAAVSHQDVAAAGEEITRAFANSAKGAQELNEKLAFLDDRSLQTIQRLDRMGDRTGAAAEMFRQFSSAMAEPTNKLREQSTVWDTVKKNIDDATDAYGRWLAGIAQQPSEADDRRMIDAARGRMQYRRDNPIMGWFSGGAGGNDLDQQTIRDAEERIRKRQADLEKNLQDAANQKAIEAGGIARGIVSGPSDYQDLLEKQAKLAASISDPAIARGAADLNVNREALARVTAAIESYLPPAEKARRLRELDLAAINARTPAQRAEIEAARARVQVAGDLERAFDGEAEARAAAARVMEDAAKADRDYAAGQNEASRQRLAAAELEAESIGQSAQENDRLRTVMELTNEARQRAFELTGDYNRVSAETTESIRREADELARLAQVRRQANLAQSISDDRRRLFMTDGDANIDRQLTDAGLLHNGAPTEAGRQAIEIDGVRVAAADYFRQQLEINDALREMKEVGKDAWSTLGDSLRSGEGIGKSFAAAGRRLLDDASKKAWDNLYDQAFSMVGDSLGLKGVFGGKRDGSSAASALFVTTVGATAPGVGGLLGLGAGGDVTKAPLAAITGAATNDNGVNARVAQAFDAGGWLKYANQSATRNQPLDPKLVNAFSFLPQKGIQMEVFSGGQAGIGSGGPRVGSTRHDHGNAADVFFSQNGRRLDWNNPADVPVYQDIVRQARANGVTGFGAGPGYMQPGSMHVGFGSPGVWGAGGRGANAPGWLREAYSTPAQATLTAGGAAMPGAAAANDNLATLAQTAGTANDGLGTLGNSFTQFANTTISPEGVAADASKLGASTNLLATSAEGAANTFSTGFTGALGSIVQGAGQIGQGFLGMFGSVLNTILGGIGSAGGGGGGGIGGILGVVGSIFGFDEGGYTGHGGKHEPAGVVHRGEYVFDAASTSRIGVGALEALRNGMPGFADGGYVGNDNYDLANDNGWSVLGSVPSAPPPPAPSYGGSETVVRLELDNKLLQAKMVQTAKPVAKSESARAGAKAVQVSNQSYPSTQAFYRKHGHTN